jgi:selenide,water dikinase
MDPKSIRLTETVKKGGCAAKLPAGQLKNVLGCLKIKKPTQLEVGLENLDDACVWDLGQGKKLIQTLDFFTPIVDDPYDFGAIAAANALSDVYAMGGAPKIALSILAFPSQTLPLEILEPLLKGALDKIQEAGACLAGGHTIDDETLKFGLSVTGFVDGENVWTNSHAKIGDVLILTKPLGTGTLTTALKAREAQEVWVSGAIESMKQLNRIPELLSNLKVNAATDITGFGLCGHTLQLAKASQVSVEIETAQLPVLEGAMSCLENEFLNRAHQSNFDYVKSETNFGSVSEPTKWLTLDPQTSGGLLLSVNEGHAGEILTRIKPFFKNAAIIGRVISENKSERIRLK